MSRLHFMLKYGTLDHAKDAVATSNKEVLGHSTAMTKLLDRMKSENDPDYEKMRDEHIGEFAKHRIKSSWVVDSQHATPEHLKTIADNFPHMMERAARNKNNTPDSLRHMYSKTEALDPKRIGIERACRSPSTRTSPRI
jgi:hypothetical protein